jgi:hypothetical protein
LDAAQERFVRDTIEVLAAHTEQDLIFVTPSARPIEDFAGLLQSVAALAIGAWLCIEPSRAGTLHAHGHLLLPREEIEEWFAEWCRVSGASPLRQEWKPITGWSEFRNSGQSTKLALNLMRTVDYARKSNPGLVIATGVLAQPWQRVANAFPSQAVCNLPGCSFPARPRGKFCSNAHRQKAHRLRHHPMVRRYLRIAR